MSSTGGDDYPINADYEAVWCPVCGAIWKIPHCAAHHEHALEVVFMRLSAMAEAARGIVLLIKAGP